MREKRDMICGCAGLTKKQVDFLDNLAGNCICTGGRKFGKAGIIRALISVLRELDIDLNEIRSEEQLKDRIVKAFCKYK